jgi:TPR repeat protein
MAQADARYADIAAARKDLDVASDLKTAEEHLRMARPKEGMEILQRRANEGHARAMTALAVAYQGYGHAPVDLAKSREWMQRAAQEGSLTAYVHLGYASETGRGTPRNPEEAANQYRKAARQGDASGLYALGLVYGRGVPGIPADKVFARMLFELAARAYEKAPEPDDFTVAAKAPHSARYEASQLEKTMSPVEVVKAKELADAWKPGHPFPNN